MELGDARPETFWNGERAAARRVRVIVADDPQFPAYWARPLVGTERDAVEVIYAGHVFYLDNDSGEGWAKVTDGRGSPRYGHQDLAIQRVVPRPGDERALSIAWEYATAADSISTIERLYDRSAAGAYICCWPDCRFARRNSASLWRHIHQHPEATVGLPPTIGTV